jgi:hypothetical protein
MRPIGVHSLSKSGPGIRTRALAVTRTSRVSVNLMALPTVMSSTCVKRCSSPRPPGKDSATSVESRPSNHCWWRPDQRPRTILVGFLHARRLPEHTSLSRAEGMAGSELHSATQWSASDEALDHL